MKASYVMVLLLVIGFLRLNTIYHAHHRYTKRLDIVRHTLATYPGKFIIPERGFPMGGGILTWGVSFETVLLSSIHSPDSCRSFAVLGNIKEETLSNNETVFHHVWGPVDYNFLNPKYFRPAPGRYRMLPEEEIENIRQWAAGRNPRSRRLPIWDL
jgi:hypothetical protein